MLSQHDLAEKWRNGAESGTASNSRIVRLSGGWTALVAYDTLVLAVRTNTGTTYAFAGWYQETHHKMSGSPSMKNMFSRMKLWDCDVVYAEDMSNDRRASKADMRATRLATRYDTNDNKAPTLENF